MSALLDLDQLPPDVLDRLRDRAAAHNRTIVAEVEALIVRTVGGRSPAASEYGDSVADAPSEADNVVYNFPRPLDGIPIQVVVGGERRPTLPIILDETPE